MARGRGSANQVAVFAVVLLCLLVHFEIAHGAIFTVGDRGGWTFNAVGWPKGKRFRAGDVLAIHNVVAVDGKSYNGCTTPRGAKVFNRGNDRISLRKGTNFFICNFPGHCQGGMKIAVNAA